jgi:hypothetical protein
MTRTLLTFTALFMGHCLCGIAQAKPTNIIFFLARAAGHRLLRQ